VDLKSSFEKISAGKPKLMFNEFKSYVERSRALLGFDLTDDLVK